MNKKISLSKYKTINELEKEIYEHYIEIKKNPLFKNKKKLLKKKINNIKNTDNSNSINNNKKMLLSSNKSQENRGRKTRKFRAIPLPKNIEYKKCKKSIFDRCVNRPN